MTVFLNGRFVPEEQALVSACDRGFLYGDGLFETMRVCHGVVFRWADHFARLEQGAAFLRIQLPAGSETMLGWTEELIARNALRDGIIRLTVSRGIGVRGYSPKREETGKKIVVRPSGDISHGFSISFDSGKSCYDFSDKALAEYIGTYLKPRLYRILEEAAKD